MKKRNKIIGIFLVLFAGILWGHSGFFVKVLTSYNASNLTISVLRIVLTAIEMTIAMAIFNPRVFKVSKKVLPLFIVTGMLGIVGSSLFYFIAINMTSLSLAAVLMYTAPTIVMILSLFIFKEKLTLKKVICVIIAFLGSMLSCGIFSSDSNYEILGILFGCLAGFSYALYSIASGMAIKKDCQPLTVTLYSFIFAVVPIVIFGNVPEVISTISSQPIVLGISSLQALMTCLAPYVLYTFGMKYTTPTNASIISTIELIVASLIGLVSFNEKLDVFSILGIVLIILSIVLININISKKAA